VYSRGGPHCGKYIEIENKNVVQTSKWRNRNKRGKLMDGINQYKKVL
jgi:hypothetical protein